MIVMLSCGVYGVSYTTLRVLFAMQDAHFTLAEEIFYVPTFTVKLLLDAYMITLFVLTFKFFMERKLAAMMKGAHARGFTTFNLFVMYTMMGLIVMRIVGSLYTFIVGIITMTDYYQDPKQQLAYAILDGLVFPIRDFIELMFFTYLFYFQSKRKSDLEAINQRWNEAN